MKRTIALVILLLACVLVTFIEGINAEDNPRHTPGFPENLPRNLEDLLRTLSEDLGKTMPELAWSFHSNATVEDLVNSINNTHPKTLVIRASQDLAEGKLTKEALYNYLSLLQEWYESCPKGDVKATEDYLLAMRALMMISSQAGYTDVSINIAKQMLDILTNLRTSYIEPSTWDSQLDFKEPIPPELLEPFGELHEHVELELGWFNRIPSLGSIPKLTIPSPPGIPSPLFTLRNEHLYYVLTFVTVALLSVVLLKNLGKIGRIKLVPGTIGGSWLKQQRYHKKMQLPIPIIVYWQAVNYVSAKYRVPRSTSTTHREYLELTKSKLSIFKHELLADLTRIYELTRFANIVDATLDEKALKAYRDLVHSDES